MRKLTLITTSLLTAALTAACAGEEPPVNYPNGGYGAAAPTGGYGAAGPTGYGAGTPTGYGGGTAAGTPTGTPAGTPTGTPTGTSSGSATPLAPAAAAMASPILRELAAREVAGAKEDGSAFAGSFTAGQVLEQPITLQPGRCYSVVGIGIGIEELDAEIVIHQPPAPEFVAAQDQTTGPQAVLGGGQSCFKNPLPIAAPAKVRVRATRGNGVALAQIYMR
ncbi:MAG: hypothetical protein R3B72_15360 [Polyangiaceae bacterium]